MRMQKKNEVLIFFKCVVVRFLRGFYFLKHGIVLTCIVTLTKTHFPAVNYYFAFLHFIL